MSGRKQLKIVVIDDSEIVLEVTRGALEGAGYEVITHDRPAGCVALILHEKPELVLMDVNMPGLGGDTIVSVLAKAAPTSDTVVLLHSSLSAEVLRGRTVTCWPSIAIDVRNAGGLYVDRPVARDGNLITSRKPDDVPQFTAAVIAALES